jgi:threonine dehydrogenase-like Zn-dependent dehydrogenase
MIMGHEIGAVDEATGVVVSVHPMLFCDACDHCRSGETGLCEHREVIGVAPHIQGGFADYISVPRRNVVPMPGVSPEHAALVEPLAVGLHAARIGQIAAGDRTVVVGGGTIGLVSLLAAKRRGADRVVVVEPSAHRRAVAETLGATTVDPTGADVVAAVAELVGDGVPCAIDAVGISASLQTALDVTARNGAVVLLGMGRPRIELDLMAVVVLQRRILGAFCYSEQDFLDAAAWVREGSLPLETLIERRVGFDEIAIVFDRLATGEDEAVKALLIPG